MSPISILAVGFLLGVRHATDADHVAAVSTMVARQKTLRSAGIVGTLWGIGHSVTVFAVGSAIILFHIAIPTKLALLFEFAVAIVLVALGVLTLTGNLELTHEHVHQHDTHGYLRPVVVGLVHGLAGSAAITLLILSTIRSPTTAMLYLLIFGLGTMIGMVLITTVLGVPIILSANKFARIHHLVTLAAGLISLAFGLYLAWDITH